MLATVASIHSYGLLFYFIIIMFTSLALQGVHKRLSLYEVLTRSQGEPINNGLTNKWDGSKKKSNSKAQQRQVKFLRIYYCAGCYM